MIDETELSPQEKWQKAPRPLAFVRVRLRVRQAEYLRDLLTDEQETLFDELSMARTKGEDEDGEHITELKDNLTHLNYALKDINNSLVDLIGPTDTVEAD